jgi:hypothetical protein
MAGSAPALDVEAALNRDIDFTAAFVISLGGQPHLHGAIELHPGELERAEEALRTAGGNYREGKGRARQLKLEPLYGDYWASYSGRELEATRKWFPLECRKGSLITASNGLRDRAKALLMSNGADA